MKTGQIVRGIFLDKKDTLENGKRSFLMTLTQRFWELRDMYIRQKKKKICWVLIQTV